MLSIPDESHFIAQLKHGDERAFLTLVEEHHASLMRMARIFVSDHALAEEIVQETWLAVIAGIQGFQGNASIKTWIFAIMSNQAKKHAKKASRTVNLSALNNLQQEDLLNPDASKFKQNGHWLEPIARWNIDPEEELVKGRLLEVIQDTVENIPEKQRIVFTMRDMQGFSAEDVTSVLELSEVNQRVLLHRARAAIREAIATYLQQSEHTT